MNCWRWSARAAPAKVRCFPYWRACCRQTRGELRLSGIDVSDSAVYLIPGHADIKLVPQEFKLLPNHTLRENIAYALREYTKEYQRERLDELIALTGLEAVQHKLPREVSGGEKQRTAIARAIADERRYCCSTSLFPAWIH